MCMLRKQRAYEFDYYTRRKFKKVVIRYAKYLIVMKKHRLADHDITSLMYDKQYHVYRVMLREVSRWTERCKHIELIESTFHIAQYYLSYLLVVQTQNKYASLYNLPTTHGKTLLACWHKLQTLS